MMKMTKAIVGFYFEPTITDMHGEVKQVRRDGYLVEDNYDPTYGDSGLVLHHQVATCKVCGAVTPDPFIHVKWHVENFLVGSQVQY